MGEISAYPEAAPDHPWAACQLLIGDAATDHGQSVSIITASFGNGRRVSALANYGIPAAAIHVLLLTTASPDHFGSINLFSEARILFWEHIQQLDSFNTFGLKEVLLF